MIEAIKKRAWHRGFFYSLEKPLPESKGELMKRTKKYIRLDDASKRQ